MTVLALLSVLGLCSAVRHHDHGHDHDRPRRWRHVDPASPVPRTLAAAAALHVHARHQVGMEIHRAGGTPSPGLFVAPTPPCGSAPPGALDPSSFGADPSGNVDSTAAFGRAMAALTNVSFHNKVHSRSEARSHHPSAAHT